MQVSAAHNNSKVIAVIDNFFLLKGYLCIKQVSNTIINIRNCCIAMFYYDVTEKNNKNKTYLLNVFHRSTPCEIVASQVSIKLPQVINLFQRFVLLYGFLSYSSFITLEIV